jgi:hypothetical protein
MDWIVILLVVAVFLVGTVALAAAVAAARGDRAREGTAAERMAIWQAGYSPVDLRLLAGIAALARAELDAGQIEVVLVRGQGSRDGLVVTGSRLPHGRLGAPVPVGDGVSGRSLISGRTTLAGLGGPAERGSESLVAIAAPIPGDDGLAGVLTATASGERLFGSSHVARLEALAAEAGTRLGAPATSLRDVG